ncbi:hypothetical protein AAFF_G00194740 [Aldrovandia affinis]|uniref:THD domain-containing protein n=1 Tax=Aldrovandia affinis TaxID=143900 RepID=A0AAD7SXJ4_9TELE|nr:hypothetical protein AAFF_G00194740 [Aldrovandia affinis]
MLAPMAVAVPGAGPGAQQRQLSRALLALTLLAVMSSSLSALSLYHILALKAEVAVLRTEVVRRREEQRSATIRQDAGDPPRDGERALQRMSSEPEANPRRDAANAQRSTLTIKKRNADQGAVFQPCLQMMANSRRSLSPKVFLSEVHTAVPWQTALKRGTALEEDSDTILVNEEGFYFVYSQVYYMDKTFAMGHIIIRRKKNFVGNELQDVTLFRCIQNMNMLFPYNTCYTAGIVKLEAGDRVELLIPRKSAIISLDGDSTLFGAVKLV